MLNDCEKIIILIGNSQSYGTEVNPFNVITRLELLKEIYGDNDRVTIGFFPDLKEPPKTEDEYPQWGDWVIRFAEFYTGAVPDVVYGGDNTKLDWIYKNQNIEKVTVEMNDITATKIRDLLKENNEEEWKKITDPKIHKYYSKLREIVLNA